MLRLLFILFPIFSFAQTFNGQLNVFSIVNTGANQWNIIGVFNNCTSEFTSDQVQIGDKIFMPVGTSVKEGTITSLGSTTGSIISASISLTATSLSPTLAGLARPSAKGLIPLICGLPADMQAAISNLSMNKLDNVPVITDSPSAINKSLLWRNSAVTDSLLNFYDARTKEFQPFAVDVDFPTKQLLQSTTRKFYVGQRITTKGYFAAGDGGGANYVVTNALEAGSTLDNDYQISIPGGLYARMDLSEEDLDKIDTRKFGVFRTQTAAFIAAQCNKVRAVWERKTDVSGFILYSGNGTMTFNPFSTVGDGTGRVLNVWFSGTFQPTSMMVVQRCNLMGIGSYIGTQFQYDNVAKFIAPSNGNTTIKLVTDGWIRDIVIDGNTSTYGGVMLGDTILQQGTGYFRGYLENVGVNSYNSGVCLRVNSMFWYWVRDCAFNCSGPGTELGKTIDIVADRRSGDGSARGSFGEFNDIIISGRAIRIRTANNNDPQAIAINPNGMDAIVNLSFKNVHSESIYEPNFIFDGTGFKLGITEVAIDRPMASDNIYQGPIIKAIGPVKKVTVTNSIVLPGVEGRIEEYILPNATESIHQYSSPQQAFVEADLKTPNLSTRSLFNWFSKFDGRWSGHARNMAPFITKGDSRFWETGSVSFSQDDNIIASRTTAPYVMTPDQTGLDGKTSAVRIQKPVGGTANTIPLHTQFSFPFTHNSGLIFGAWIKGGPSLDPAVSSTGILRIGKSETVAEFVSDDCQGTGCQVVVAKDPQLKIPGSDWTLVLSYTSISNPTNDPGVFTYSIGEFNSDPIDAIVFKPFIAYAPGNLNDYEIRALFQSYASQTINLPPGVLDAQALPIYFDANRFISLEFGDLNITAKSGTSTLKLTLYDGGFVVEGLRSFANEAAAIADPTLRSNSFYKINNQIYIKP